MTQTEKVTLMWVLGALALFAMIFTHDYNVERARLDAGIYPTREKVSAEMYQWRPLAITEGGDTQHTN